VSKKKADEELVGRAILAFGRWGGRMPTGAGGIDRREMRLLERGGYVVGELMRLNSGTMVKMWKLVAR
jgi:hypothetical protein